MDRIAALQKDLDVVLEEWSHVKRNRGDCKFRQLYYGTGRCSLFWVAQKKKDCRVRMESLELALEMARSSGTSIEVKKELIETNTPPIPLEYQGDVGTTAEKALHIDEMSVE